MDNEHPYQEEYSLHPEYTVPPEYTPEYPDVSFFQESYVTAREENIFQGEVPPGETDPYALRKEKRKKQSRFAWLRGLFGSAVRGGVIVFAICSLIVALVPGTDPEPDTRLDRVKTLVTDLKKPPLTTPEDYGPGELLALWRGEPEAPHQYDFEHAVVRKEANCQGDGLIEYICSECGVALKESVKGGHVPAEAVQENAVEAACLKSGSYEEVVYCSVCHEELSRNKVTVQPKGHTPQDAVIENEVGAVCTEGGSYEEVVYCSVCHMELSRQTFVQEAAGHTADEAVTENEIPSTCLQEGSYESVVYCKICGTELSRESVKLPLADHTEAEAVEENRVEASCTEDGSCDLVIYCAVCHEELSRTHTVLEAMGHKEAAAVRENESATDCTSPGSYDEVIYCSVCHEELSRRTETTAALGHDFTESVTAPTCTEQGYTTHTCSRCGESYRDTYTAALGHSYGSWTTVSAPSCTAAGSEKHTCSRCGNTETQSIAATGHTPGDPVRQENYVAATCTTAGSYDSNVVHCTVCNAVLSKEHHTIAAHGHSFYLSVDEEILYCGYGCGTPAITLSYNRSTNVFTITGNADFVNQLRNDGYTVRYQAFAFNSDTARFNLNDDFLYWSLLASSSNSTSFEAINLSSNYPEIFPSGSTARCQLRMEYWNSSSDGIIYSPIITITVP